MKSLLIIGAGGHGRVVREIAEALGYDKIDFLDDNPSNSDAIGTIDEMDHFLSYREAICSIGNNETRADILSRLITAGFAIPTLAHPTAFISKSAVIGSGSVIEPHASINANVRIGQGCIIGMGAIVDHDANVGISCHINSGTIVRAGTTVPDFSRKSAGDY